MTDLDYIGIELMGILVCVVLIYLELRQVRKDHTTLIDLIAYGRMKAVAFDEEENKSE